LSVQDAKFCPIKSERKRGWHLSAETRAKQRAAKLGEKNPRWAGDNTSDMNARDRARRLIGTKPSLDIHHKDNNPFNNSPENLEYTTRREHMKRDGRLNALIQRNKNGSKKPRFCPICGSKLHVDGKRLLCDRHGEMNVYLTSDPKAALELAKLEDLEAQ